jgi:transcriptional regulator with XRE-family HTH domain
MRGLVRPVALGPRPLPDPVPLGNREGPKTESRYAPQGEGGGALSLACTQIETTAYQSDSRHKTRARAVVPMTAGDRERAGCRRPIDPSEVPYLELLGAAVRALRGDAGLAQARLAELAQVSASTVGKIEAGTRRTRRSTLGRITAALVGGHPDLGEADELADELAALAGPALAPESEYADRVARRRKRRWRRRRNQEASRSRETERDPKQQAQLEVRGIFAELRALYPEEYVA